MEEGDDGFGMVDLGIQGPKMDLENGSLEDLCMREAFGLAELDFIWNLSLRFIATLSSFGIHIILVFLIFSLCGVLILLWIRFFLFLDRSFRGDMLILVLLWIFDFIFFFFGIQFASIGYGMGA